MLLYTCQLKPVTLKNISREVLLKVNYKLNIEKNGIHIIARAKS